MTSREYLTKRKEYHEKCAAKLQTKIDLLDQCKFDVGMVAHHKEHGNVLIVEVKSLRDKVFYDIQTTKGKVSVPEGSLITFTPNANTLYG